MSTDESSPPVTSLGEADEGLSTSRLRVRMRLGRLILLLVVSLLGEAIISVGAANADTVTTDIAGGTITAPVGASGVFFHLSLVADDQPVGDVAGCDAAPQASVLVGWNNNPATVQVPPVIPFPVCNQVAVPVTGLIPGTYKLHATITGGVPGSLFVDNADFTVIVTGATNTPPTLQLPSDQTAEAAAPNGAPVTYTATASDAEDGPLTPTCAPASGATFPLGTTTVACSVTDSGGLTTSGTFNVTVTDTTPPTLHLPADQTVEAAGPNGAQFTFSASADDLVDGSAPVACSPSSGSTFPLGTTSVTCTATDSHGNTATGTFNVTVVDTTPPTLNLPGPIQTTATQNSKAAVSFQATATDLVDGSIPVSCTPASGASFPVGMTTVSCSATDAHGNTATGSFTVTVSYHWSGFFQPVDNTDANGNYILNIAKAGATIPVKFSLNGNQGLSILASGSPSTVPLNCATDQDTDAIETYTNSTSGLSYDPAADQYNYNWKTQSSWAGTCRTLLVKLADGTIHRADFKFTK